MAGSYNHIVNDDGTFRGYDLLDHMGDAWEALEDCYWMIQHLSGGSKERIEEARLIGLRHGRTEAPVEAELREARKDERR
jgi:hypothetical protein